MHPVPKPDLHQLVDAIRELTALGGDDLAAHTGVLNADAENVLRRIVTRAIERGVDLQRAALLLDADLPQPKSQADTPRDERDTLPPPWDPDGKTPVVHVVEVDGDEVDDDWG